MAKLAVKNNTKGKESKVFPYEMTELVWEEEEELQKLLRREVRQIELQIKRQMFWQRCLNEKLTSRKLLKNHCEKIFC